MVVVYMTKYYGEVVTIKSVHKGFYRIKEDGGQYCWIDEMFECKMEEETKPDPKFKVGDILFYRGATSGYLKVEEIREENGEIRYYETSRNIYLPENDPDVFVDKVCSVETEETKSKFKVGDIIISDVFTTKDDKGWKVIDVERTGYKLISVNNSDLICDMDFKNEHYYKLVEEESANYSKVIDNGVSNPIIAKTSSATIDTDKGFYSYSSDGNLEMEWNLPKGYQFKDENGNVINATKIVLEKKKKEYPKTYGECCKVLGLSEFEYNHTCTNVWYRHKLMATLDNLMLCRNAYWKIAGEEMGLGKPWEPDWTDLNQLKYCIWVDFGEFTTPINVRGQHMLAFPTAKMRDAFYENFKELINECKELL